MNYLPDVSAWLALAYDGHIHHDMAAAWFYAVDETESIFFCRVSQMGLLRLLTQADAMGARVQTQRGAWSTYARLLEDARVYFMQEASGIESAFRTVSNRDEVTPKLWTDDYLAAFSTQSELTLVTCDRRLAARSPGAILLTR